MIFKNIIKINFEINISEEYCFNFADNDIAVGLIVIKNIPIIVNNLFLNNFCNRYQKIGIAKTPEMHGDKRNKISEKN